MVKRPRGRPRKVVDDADVVTAVSEVVKRRGRPKKVVEGKAEVSSSEPGKRGRPKKVD